MIRVLFVILAFVASASAAHAEAIPAPLHFIVARNGTPIGTHSLTFHADGDRLIVDIAIDIKVKAAFITLYTYHFKGRETWQGGRLVAMETSTDDNGTKIAVRVDTTDQGLKVAGSNVNYTAPPTTLTDSYWRADMVRHTQFIDIEDGKLITLVSTPAGRRTVDIGGKAVDTVIYKLTGEIEGEIGYTPTGEWTLLRFKSHGDDILYTRDAR